MGVPPIAHPMFGSQLEMPLDFLYGIPELGTSCRHLLREKILITQILITDKVCPHAFCILIELPKSI
jgi:hypothetical protein